MLDEIVKKTLWGEYNLELKTGKIARQCDGSVVVSLGDTVVLCTIAVAKEVKEGVDFFPLTVHYREMAFSAGKIPGGFIKREGKASDREILVARLIDRALRPLFLDDFYHETQIICTVLSYDPNCPPDIAAIIGSSAALAISGIPVKNIVAAAKVGYIDGNFVLNPNMQNLEKSELDIVVAGSKDSILMVEAGCSELSEDKILESIEFATNSFKPIIELIEELKNETSKPQLDIRITKDHSLDELTSKITELYSNAVESAFEINDKKARAEALASIERTIKDNYPEYPKEVISTIYENLTAEVLRNRILHDEIRIGGRKYNQIRPIECEIDLLPRVHGSSLFTRGETQSIAAVTLGTSSDEQIIDSIEGEYREHFMLHYIFPPYSVGETSAFKAPGRREIGHGRLAWRAISNVLPKQEEFPYAIRVVSEITESNGSSSMATVCSTSLALMAAGVPIKSPVAGIAMGLIIENDKYAILSDIIGDEDFLGDMDFKVAGTNSGITALQMDIKVAGINMEILKSALYQAKEGRMHILSIMNQTIETANKLSIHAPAIETLKIDKDKIRDLIGPGGKIIKDLCEKTSCKIDITDDGTVTIAAPNSIALEKAKDMVIAVVFEPKIGDTFDGTVVKIIDSGAFVNYIGSRDGFLHISEVSEHKILDINTHLKIDQKVQVKVIGFDNRGKVRLSMRHSNGNVGNPEEPETKAAKTKPEKQFKDKRSHVKEEAAKTNRENEIISERKYFN